jgi:hypothetical protein
MPSDRLREPVRYLVFSEYLGEHPEPALDRVE